MFEKLASVEERFEEITHLLSDPSVIGDHKKFRDLSRERSDLEPLIESYRSWERASKELKEALEMMEDNSDPEMREMAIGEVPHLRRVIEKLTAEITILLIPKDPNDDKNIILEMRAGTGGDESALFCEELFGAYLRFAERKGWKVEMLNSSHSSVGGYKDVIATMIGHGAYSVLKYESGVHRVQRVPKTETQGRVHTSTVTVAVLPEADEVDIEIHDKDLRIDVFRSSGPGGQSVNTTDSAVRITHLPTGLVVSCQDQKSQIKNKAKGMTVLRSRLFDLKQAEIDKERSADRKSQIGTGERSEKVRTYNFPQSRVTDHRIGLTIYQLDEVMKGSLNLLIDPLNAHFQAESLKGEAT